MAVVAIEAFGLNRADVLYLRSPEGRWRVGIDGAGVVVAAGEGGPPTGTRVVVHLPEGGAAAERIAIAAHRLVPLPEAVTSVTAAALPLPGLVALRLLARAGEMSGRRVLVTGATGGVGLPLIQLARAAGAEVCAVVRGEERYEHLRGSGAEIRRDGVALPGPFDVVFESVGGPIGDRAVRAVAPGGRVVWFGQASARPLALDFFEFLGSGQGFSLHHFVYSDGGADPVTDLGRLVALTAEGVVRPSLGSIEDWSLTGEALYRIGAGEQQGKAVLTIPHTERD
ncbi:zinc-binding dehydrogenase [Nocardia puris]|uniref:zinc-binding dehydrogenase n=1 Tax=Nocardia puris TaxID=208602 RepID=UPI00397F545B